MLFLLPNYPFSIWDELPLQPCNFSLLCLLVGCLCDQKLLLRWSHCFGVPFALLAMLLPLESFTNISVFSPLSLGFYGHHTMVIVLCASVFFFQLVEVRYAHIMQMLGSTICVTVLCHLFNICLRNTVYPEANYFYTFGLAGNVLLETAKQYIPYDLFYLAPFLLACLLWCAGVALLEQTILPKLGSKLIRVAKPV